MNRKQLSLGRSLAVGSLVSLFGFAPNVFAATQEQDHEAHHPEQAQTGGQAESPSGMMPMQGHMRKMHRTMEQIQAAEDPKERQKLLDDHMAQMHDMMNMMHGMRQGQSGGGMMGMMGPNMMGTMHGQGGGMMGGAPMGGKPCPHMGGKGMSGGMMGGQGMHGGMMGGRGMQGGMMGGGMATHMQQRMDNMQQQMDTMQQMMAQMLQHQKESKQAK